MKYALVVLCALLVGCGGLTKEQQGDAYLGAAGRVNAAWDNAEVEYRSAIENSYTESTVLEAMTNFYSTVSAADLDFIKDLQAVKWSDVYSDTAGRLISCMNELYVIERNVTSVTDLQAAINQANKADEKNQNCRGIANELRISLGLDPVPD